MTPPRLGKARLLKETGAEPDLVTMSTSDDKSSRQAPRNPLQIDLSEYLFRADTREPLRCLGVDLSRVGLGIVGFAKVEVGEKVHLIVNGKGITLDVVWVKPDAVRPGVTHAGLKTRDVAHDLEKEFAKAGLLKKVESSQFPTFGAKKPP